MERQTPRFSGKNGWRKGALALGIALALGSTGCRSTRSEVPAGRGFSPESGGPPPVSFSSQPNMNALNGLPGAVGAGAPGGQFGTPAPGANPYGAPTANSFGGPGTSGLSGSPSLGAASGAGLAPGSTLDPSARPASGPSTFGAGAPTPSASSPGASDRPSVPSTNPFQ